MRATVQRFRTAAALMPAALALALTFTAGAAHAQDAKVGRMKAQACTVCHGPVGLSTQPDAPHLANQPAIYLSSQLKAYQTGTRKHEVMSVMARTLSEEDIRDLAAWFSSIRLEAEAPR